MPEAKDGFFITYYAFNKIVLDVLMEKFNIQVDDDTVTQSALLHSDIPHTQRRRLYDIYTLRKVLLHMIDEKDVKIFKSHDDCARNKRKFIQYLKYAETWQSMSVICLYAAFLCDILLIVVFIAFFLKCHKTIQIMLAAKKT